VEKFWLWVFGLIHAEKGKVIGAKERRIFAGAQSSRREGKESS